MKISLVMPAYNEVRNLSRLYAETTKVLSGLGYEYEIIVVNDGSRDDSIHLLSDLAAHDSRLKVIDFLSNRGQTAALMAGLENSSGDIIVTMDSDLENDPADIPLLLKKLDEGYDVVSGWREDRWRGKWLTRKLPSVVANWLISRITGIRLHDYGCILKAYKRNVIAGVPLYGEMHRFIPAYASWRGAKVTEIKVNYHTRIHGTSNYGMSRIFKVLLDLVTIKFLDRYMNKPMHFFGGIGFISLSIGIIAGTGAVVLKILHLRSFVSTPLPVFSALFIIVGVQLIAMGIIAEILMRTYYGSQNKKPYDIKQKINF